MTDVDRGVTDRLHELALRHDWLVDLMRAVSVVLGPYVLRPVVTVLGVALLVRGRTRTGAWVLTATWGSALLTQLLKAAVGRARPVLADPVAHAAGLSFPSGHALGGTVCLGLLALVLGPRLSPAGRRLAWAAATAGVLLVSASRVVLGVHYLTDVTGGILIGAAWLAATAAAFRVRPGEAT